MPFVEQEESFDKKIVKGEEVLIYKPRVEVTIKHIGTGREYMSDMEAQADLARPLTATVAQSPDTYSICLIFVVPILVEL